jgi:heme exporter protein C
MKRNWWKLLCVALLFVTFIVGLLTPTAPGIISAEASAASTSAAPFTVTVHGYNTHFQSQAANTKAWLSNGKKGEYKSCASSVKAISETELLIEFPPVLPIEDPLFNLSIYNDADGPMLMPSAISSSDTERGGITQVCQPQIKNDKPDHFAFPFRYILYESMRNLFFHVPMWFAMIALLTWALWNNLRYLRKMDLKYDLKANEAVNVGLVFGILGLITGSVWARVTWGAWWVDDVKLNGTAITMLAYLAYVVLRNAIEDEQKRATVSAIYSIFAYVMMIVLIGLLPRLGADSLHPGNGGNPAFSSYDLDNSLRPIFYSGVLGWILLGFWIYQVKLRIRRLNEHLISES